MSLVPRAVPAVVLVVEDEPMQRMMVADLVGDAGFVAMEAADADEALCMLRSRPDFRVVITDIDMPGSLNGLELAVLIRDRWPPIEVIVTSGRHHLSAADLPSRGLFFPKPIQQQELVGAVRSFVDR